MEFPRTLLDALKLAAFVVPQRPARRIGPGHLWLAMVAVCIVDVGQSWLESEPPRAFWLHGIGPQAAWMLAVVFVGYAVAVVLARPALWWPFATLFVLTQIVVGLAVQYVVSPILGWQDVTTWDVWLRIVGVWFAWSIVATKRILDYLDPHRPALARAAASFLVMLAILPVTIYASNGTFFYTDYAAETADDEEIDDPEAKEAAEAASFDPERVMIDQGRLLGAAIDALAPQRPGVPDLYVVAFGGDGSENVFRNEVEYVERLYAQRFGAAGRTLVLVNNPATLDTRPLATLTNLERALHAVGERIDPAEDLALVFVTTHGAESHELYVALDPLPLNQIRPDDLAAALAQSKIRARVVVVSACYSGGFIPALRADDALVIAAARHDRTSFGCGVESEITYFGRAFFAEALNETASFTDAFERAKKRIAEWEKKEDDTPSEPQIDVGKAIEPRIAAWLASFEPGPKVEFEPAAEIQAVQK